MADEDASGSVPSFLAGYSKSTTRVESDSMDIPSMWPGHKYAMRTFNTGNGVNWSHLRYDEGSNLGHVKF